MARQVNSAMPDVSDPRFRAAATRLGLVEIFDATAAQRTIKATPDQMPLVFQAGIEGMANVLAALLKRDMLKEVDG